MPVNLERRSGKERRLNTRIELDAKVKKDYEHIQKTFAAFDPKPDMFINYSNNNKADTEKENLALCGLNSIPFIRRITGIGDAFKSHEYIKTLGKGFIQIINVRGDWNDIVDSFKKTAQDRDIQSPFGFLRFTCLEDKKPFVNLRHLDKTLYDYQWAENILTKLGAETPEFLEKGIKLNGTLVSTIVGKIFLRTPIVSLGVLEALEIPSIIKNKEHGKQTIRSTINVTSLVFGGAILGAIASTIHPSLSLVGLGVGSYLGTKAANMITDELFPH